MKFILLILLLFQLFYVLWDAYALHSVGKSRQLIFFFVLFGFSANLFEAGLLIRICSDEYPLLGSVLMAVCALLIIPACHVLTRAALQYKPVQWKDVVSFFSVAGIYIMVVVLSWLFSISPQILHLLRYECFDFVCCAQIFILLYLRMVNSRRIKGVIYDYYADFNGKNHHRSALFHLWGCTLFFVLYSLFVLRSDFFEHNLYATFFLYCYFLALLLSMGRYSRLLVHVPCEIEGRDFLRAEEIASWQKRLALLDEADLQPEVMVELKYVEDRVQIWMSSENQPYLAPGLTVKSVSEQMHVNASQLSAYLNKSLDTNFNSWINSLRIEHAKKLIVDPSNKLEYIAVICGFSDRSVFSRTFTKLVGMSVRDYRNKHCKRDDND